MEMAIFHPPPHFIYKLSQALTSGDAAGAALQGHSQMFSDWEEFYWEPGKSQRCLLKGSAFLHDDEMIRGLDQNQMYAMYSTNAHGFERGFNKDCVC